MTVISGGPDRFTNNPSTALNGAINSSVTAFNLNAILGFPNPGPFRIIVDNEQIQVTGGYGTTAVTGIRGVDGTAPAGHANNALVTNNITAFNFNSFRQEFNVLAYGAVGDGVADDSVPFQQAIEDAHLLTPGGHIYLPDLPFKVNSTLNGYSNVAFVTYGAVISGTGASSVTPLFRRNLNGSMVVPGALTISSGGAGITGNVAITGNISVSGTTTINTVAYTWPGSSGSNGQVLTSNGAGSLSWAAAGGAVSSVTGTANQVTVSPTTGATVVSLPSSGTLPGAWSAATGFTVTTGGITVSAGGVTVNAGGISVIGGITGTLATANQPNVTQLGTLAGLNLTFNSSVNNVPVLPSSQSGGTGIRIWVQSGAPSSPTDGDLWFAG